MPFRALLDGQPVAAAGMDPAQWAELGLVARREPGRLTMRCCGVRAVPCASPLGRCFFRHRRQSPFCDWAPESDEHLDLKEVVACAVVEAGWAAEVEAIGPDWKADVLAVRGPLRIAFEVQLSPQSRAETVRREARYVAAGVTPWWIAGARNAGKGFGSGLRSALAGRTAQARLAAARKAVAGVLARVESQVEIADAIRAALARREIGHEPVMFGAVPVAFRARLGDGREQPIAIGELGPDSIPDALHAMHAAQPLPWGGVVQFVRLAPQASGSGATAFRLRRRNIAAEVDAMLDRLLARGLVWRGRDDTDLIEASFVWYDDCCGQCGAMLVRTPYVIHAHRKIWPERLPSLIAFDRFPEEVLETQIRRLAERLGRRVGALVHRYSSDPARVETPLRQICPSCGSLIAASLISAADALAWPRPEVDFRIAVGVAKTGWLAPVAPAERPPPQDLWEGVLQRARARRDRQEAESGTLHREGGLPGQAERHARQAERGRGGAEAKAWEARRQGEAAERWASELRNTSLIEARERLRRLALGKWRDVAKAEFWLGAYDRKLGGRPRDLCLERYDACVKALKAARFS